ncbi:hypothetical protein [Robertkochia aurantiaca]|uniref:hypothetical protein n=1 Tax=Robertkochia aurantiaca TaxID=2873700 RepID=UPI001CCCC520|nr:hypothetical protein [Robertkochia sp. 3YJGBD-33]
MKGFGSQIRSKSVKRLAVYQKALEIFRLSRSITASANLSGLDIMDQYRHENADVRLSDHLIMTSLGLAPKIAMAESTKDPNVKFHSIEAIRQSTDYLMNCCERLEQQGVTRKEFTRLLKKELNKFGKLQQKWAIRISAVN